MARNCLLIEIQALAQGAQAFATWSPTDKGSVIILSGGNLTATHDATSAFGMVRASASFSAGRWYFELTNNANGATAGGLVGGVATATAALTYPGAGAGSWGYRANASPPVKRLAGLDTNDAAMTTLGVGQRLMVAIDCDAGKGWFGNNGVWSGGGDPALGTTPTFTFTPGTTLFPALGIFNQPQSVTANFGASAFAHTVPNGYNTGVYTIGASTASTLYLGSELVVSTPTATPANTVYEDRLQATSDPYIDRSVSCWVWGGDSSKTSIGVLRFSNRDRKLDAWRALVFRNRPIILRYGTPTAATDPSTCAIWAQSIVDRIEHVGDYVDVYVGDLMATLEKAAVSSLYSSSVGNTAIRDRGKPLCLGLATNVDPVLVEPATRTYDVNDEIVSSIVQVTDQADPDVLTTDYTVTTNGFKKVVDAVGKVAATVRGCYKRVATLINEPFTSWTASSPNSNPTGWTVAEVSANACVQESPTGQANLFSTGAGSNTVYMQRNLGMTSGQTYLCEVRVTGAVSGTLDFYSVAGATQSASHFQITPAMGPGTYQFSFSVVLGFSTLRVRIPDTGASNFTIDQLDVYQVRLAESLGDVLENLALRGGLTTADLDATSITALETKAPYKLGYYSRANPQVKQVIAEVMDSFTGWAVFDRLGKLTVGRLERPASASVITLTRNVLKGPVTRRPDRMRGLSTLMGATRNWTVHGDSDFATSVSQATRALLRETFQATRRALGIIDPFFDFANNAGVRYSLLQTAAEALSEISRVASLVPVGATPAFYEGVAVLDQTTALQLAPGQTITVVQPVFGMDVGRNLVLTRNRTSWRSNAVQFTAWGTE